MPRTIANEAVLATFNGQGTLPMLTLRNVVRRLAPGRFHFPALPATRTVAALKTTWFVPTDWLVFGSLPRIKHG